MLKPIAFLSLLLLLTFSALSLVQAPPAPPGPVGPYLNGIFPTRAPGASGAWGLEDAWPELAIPSPLQIIPFPGTDDLLVLSKRGEVWRVSLSSQTQSLVLDIKDRAFKAGEAGTTSIALHPRFGDPTAPEHQEIFVFYRYKPNPNSWNEKGYNRLSRFRWDEQAQRFSPGSEQVLIQQYDRSTWHNGGGLFFHPDDGFLYLALGDEGHQQYKDASNQRLDRGLFGGLIRIDVDNNPDRSHPIRRQPQPAEWGPEDPDWGPTFSQGYSIPNDNPWQSPDSSALEEFFAIGLRSPYSTSFDLSTKQIWVADVGQVLREEVSIIERGDNLQWPFMEGTAASETHNRPQEVIGQEKAPLFEYSREVGPCIIGGGIYRGALYPNLGGKYLFADYIKGFIKALEYDPVSGETSEELIIANVKSLGLSLPDNPGITGLFPQPDGNILVTVQGNEFDDAGKILRLTAEEAVADPPQLLSDLGVFTDLTARSVSDGILPYTVNAPLWSDGALKQRWAAIPNDGQYDTPEEQIAFSRKGDWAFPEGTVFIKHFELPVGSSPQAFAPLETRFFILGAEGRGYGLTYKWNEEGTDAVLLQSGAQADYALWENGAPAGTQTWEFPSRAQCLDCHTANAGFVLGVKTHQLNGDLYYPASGQTLNQLDYLSQIGVLGHAFTSPADYPKSYALTDDEASLGLRVRSYLDANCAPCHRPGGIPEISLDFRFQTPLYLQNMVSQPVRSANSGAGRLIVQPGNHAASEIWIRDASLATNQMPPLARSIIDEAYLDKLAEWIDGLPADAGQVDHWVLYPNPAAQWLSLRAPDSWEGPFELAAYNLNGQLVQRAAFEDHSYFFALQGLPAGAYLLQLSNGQQQATERFIVQ